MLEFKEETHEYLLDGKRLISVTQLLRKHNLSPSYDGVSEEVLRKKAERGTLIHKEIEEFNKKINIGFSKELTNYINFINKYNVDVLESEFMVNNDVVAGTIDLIYFIEDKMYISDIKTTSTLHYDSVKWQLSIYAYLYWLSHDRAKELARLDYNNTSGQALHFNKDSDLKVVDVQLMPFDEVDRLIESERNSQQYELETNINANQLIELTTLEHIITTLDTQLKEAKSRKQELTNAILGEMKNRNLKTIEKDNLKITYVAPYEKQSIDSKRLKEEKPEIYSQYIKTSKIEESIKITIKKEKEND